MATKVRSLNAKSLTDEDVVGLSWEARLVWAYLPCYADRSGRMDDKPTSLRMEMLPMNPEVDMEEILAEFARMGFITRYEVGKKAYIEIKSWSRYQRPYPREPDSPRPGPGEQFRPLEGNGDEICETPMSPQQDATLLPVCYRSITGQSESGQTDDFSREGSWEVTKKKWLEAGYWSEEKQPMMAAKKMFLEKINFSNWPKFWQGLCWAVEISKQRDERQYLGLLYTFIKESKWKLQEPPETIPEEEKKDPAKVQGGMGY